MWICCIERKNQLFKWIKAFIQVYKYFNTVFQSDKDYPYIFRVHTRPSSCYSSTKTQLIMFLKESSYLHFLANTTDLCILSITFHFRSLYIVSYCHIYIYLTLILPRSRTGTVWFYTSTSNKRAARPKLYTESLTRDLKLMYSRFALVRIAIKL